jgi:hypothetical protein
MEGHETRLMRVALAQLPKNSNGSDVRCPPAKALRMHEIYIRCNFRCNFRTTACMIGHASFAQPRLMSELQSQRF